MTELKFLGHACFILKNGQTSLIFDPFLSDNPFQVATSDEIQCNYILVSHGHSDHLGDAMKISLRTKSIIISTAEVAGLCSKEGCNTHAMHIGGKYNFDFGYVRITPAFHGSGVPGGHACGFIIKFFDTIIYFAGDTGIFGDMALLGRLENIDYALLPIGDNFTMGPIDAAEAVGLLNPQNVIPMHYNTWPVIQQNPINFKQDVETRFKTPVHIMEPGQTINL